MSARAGSRFLAEMLQAHGVTHVFYVDAILRETLVEMESLGIGRILTHSEKAAAYMADGYARVSGRVGVCMAQSVGAANLAAGLQDAYLGGSPVIALTGRKPNLYQQRNAYQEIDHEPVYRPVTKYQATVENAGQLGLRLRQAWREATCGTPGPAHLDVMGIRGEVVERTKAEPEEEPDTAWTRQLAHRPVPEPARLDRAAERLSRSERPVIVAGAGARNAGAGEAIVALAERGSIPVATSTGGKGTIPEDHHLSVGVVGSYARWCANQIVSEADLVVFVGSRTGDQVTLDWTLPRPGTPIIQIDIDPAELGRNYTNTWGLLGDPRETMLELLARMPGDGRRADWAARGRELVAQWEAEYRPVLESEAVPVRPERLCRELAQALPDDGVLVADTGYSTIWTATMVPITQPGQCYLRAAGSLGWAFPAAMGAQCAAPDRPVICFAGDGGLMYHLSELETASRYGIRVVTVVNNNSGLGQCVPGVNRAYGDRGGDRGQMYRFRPVNYARMAEEMGCVGLRVEDPGSIGAALREALGSGRPAVVDVVTELGAEAPWIASCGG